MQAIYALPFILLSAVSCLVCLGIPRLRRYAIPVLVTPVAFGVCAIIGMGAIVLIADQFGWLTGPTIGVQGWMTFALVFVTPGMLGAWIAVSLAVRVQNLFSK